MDTPPTDQDLEFIEHTQEYWDKKLTHKFFPPIIGEPSPYGKELLEDTEALLSLTLHQEFIESSLRDFHSYLAKRVLNTNVS